MAHKKAAGAAKNLRDSQPKYRGIKLFGGQKAVAWNIIVRQNGSKYECGANTYLASDFSIHAATDGIVMFKQKNFKRFDGRTYLKTVVYVAPETEVKAEKKAPAKKVEAPKAEAKKEEKVEVKEEAKAEKKAPAKKAAAPKKAPVKKATAEKKPAAKRTTAAKAPAKKAPAKKEKKAE